jgi:hypothetical protein
MTSKEFVIWLTGFVEAIDKEPTLTQLNTVKDKLTEVNDEEQIRTPIGVGGFGVPVISTLPNGTGNPNPPNGTGNPNPPNGTGNPNPPNGTGNPNPIPLTFTISTMSGSSIINGVTSNGTTSITYGYPSGSSWHYTDVFNKK